MFTRRALRQMTVIVAPSGKKEAYSVVDSNISFLQADF
jgi:hypothetical protein